MTDDLKYLLECVEAHADKFPVPSHIRALVQRIRASPEPPTPAGEFVGETSIWDGKLWQWDGGRWADTGHKLYP